MTITPQRAKQMASDTQLNIILKAQDQATQELKKVNESLGPTGFSGAISNAMSVAGGFILAQIMANATTQVENFVKSAVKDFGDYQAAQAQISAVVKSTGNYYHLTSDQIKEYGDSLKGTTVYTRTQTDQALGLLLSFKELSGQSIPDLLQVSADLATRTGQDLPDATQKLGKALQDPIHGARLLRAAGVELTTGMQEQIKTMQNSGDITGAQNIILDNLKFKVAGAAQAYGNTLPGEVAKARRSLQEFKIDAVEKVKTWIDNVDWGKVTSDIGAMWKAVQPIVNAFKDYIKEWVQVFETNLLPDLDRVWKALSPALTDALKLAAELIGLSFIVQLKIAVIALHAIGDVMNWVADVISGGAGFIKRVWADLSGFIKGLPNDIKTGWNGLTDILQAPFKEAFNAIARMWNDTVGKMSLHAPSWVPGIGGKGFDVPKIPLLAAGTDNWPGGLAILGDQGPELVNLPQGATVTPAVQTAQMLQSIANNSSNQSNFTFSPTFQIGMYAGLPSEKRALAVDLYREMVREARAHGVQLPQIGSVSMQ